NDPAKGVVVNLVSRQKLVMPATLRVDFADGTHRDIRLPVETWRFSGTPKVTLPTTRRIAKLELDPGHKLPDADRSNDSYTMR
ncbi:MAG: M1 family peptidase, partial [Xanthomonadaceae bacterium]|nr:M1 family peptidase [Xanthomonadaceae bacterium]